MTVLLAGCVPLLAPDGVIAVVTRPWRQDHGVVETSGLIAGVATAVSLEVADCRRAVHAVVRDDRFVARHTPRDSACANDGRAPLISQVQHDDLTILTPRRKS